ncbi:hypothetical protein P4K68_28365 [Bacillus cereus]|nr:hypothetical protein [Bacillus cereus]
MSSIIHVTLDDLNNAGPIGRSINNILQPGEFQNNRHVRSPIPATNHINVLFYASHPNAPIPFPQPTSLPDAIVKRIREDIKDAEALFEAKCGKTIKLRGVWREWDFVATSDKLDPTAPQVTTPEDLYPRVEQNLSYFPEISIFIWYILGDYLPDPKSNEVFGRNYSFAPQRNFHIILITEKAARYTLAHELGHALNESNINGPKDDPDPDPDPDERNHNKNPDNLMYKKAGGSEITEDQCNQFFESSIIRP